MIYITIPQQAALKQISLEEYLFSTVSPYANRDLKTSNTRTFKVDFLNQKYLEKINIDEMVCQIEQFNKSYVFLQKAERSELYDTFHIPKKKGGFRRIDAPKPTLSIALYQLKDMFESFMLATHHTTAFAYVKRRCTVDAIKRHQYNESNWFLSIDYSDFFSSTTKPFVLGMLQTIFPFSEIMKTEDGKQVLAEVLDLCFLNGGLPQGTPISPLLTNIIMIPIDHEISNSLKNFEQRHFVYTRYADDLLLSCKIDFQAKAIEDHITGILQKFNAPYKINKKKTHYGSRAGKNFHLGLMLNKENEITIGHKNKKRFKASIDNYYCGKVKKMPWDINDVQILYGYINYYKMIEPEYIDYVIRHYNEKHRIDIYEMIKNDLKISMSNAKTKEITEKAV